MSIITRENGTFLQLDTLSVRETVLNTLKGLGLSPDLTSTVREIKSRSPEKTGGMRVYDTYDLGYTLHGPFGEEMKARLRIQDSTVPGMAFKVTLGAFRLLCLNGMYGFGEACTSRIIHRTGDTAQTAIRALPDAIVAAVNGMPKLQAELEHLAAIDIPDPIQVLMSLDIPNGVREGAFNVIKFAEYRKQEPANTAWGLYNIVNECDRLHARKGSTAYLERDERLADDIVCLASAQTAA